MKMKKALSLLLAIGMACSLAVPSFAEATPETAMETTPEISVSAEVDDTVPAEAPVTQEELTVQEEQPTQEETAAIGLDEVTQPSDVSEETVSLGTYAKDTTGFVTRMYAVVTGRNPDATGLSYWVTQLNNHTATGADIMRGFFLSNEYKNKNKSNEQIITDCYAAMFDRAPDQTGSSYWLSCLSVGMTPEAVCAGFAGSNEFKSLCAVYGIDPGSIKPAAARDDNYARTYFVYRLYSNCLGRTPDEGGLENWCNELRNGKSGSEVAAGFVFSREFKNFHLSNEDYVRTMYRTILGREAEAGGLTDWVSQLNSTHTREHIFNGFLQSNEFAKQCTAAAIAVGSSLAEPDSSDAWQMNVAVLELCNQQRKANGLGTLTTNSDIWAQVGQVRAAELPTLFSHNRPNGSTCWTAYDEAGFRGATGENIAAGQPNAQSVVNAWMNSSGHRANILSVRSNVLVTGFCYREGTAYGTYYCQNFLS